VAEFLAQPNGRMWLAEDGVEAVGFLSLLLDSPEPVGMAAGGAEIPRIFLLPGARGKGLGRRLLEPALAAASAAGAAYVWLDAMASADRAIGAYRKWGFVPIGTTRFPKPVHPQLADMAVLKFDRPR
jgi:ribosomal protein S18 acetylase RimI-like enzyme